MIAGPRAARMALVGALTVAAGMLAATQGASGAALKEQSSSVAIPVGATAEQAVGCEGRKRYVAAGFDSPSDLAGFDGPFNLTHKSRRKKGGHLTAAHNLGGAAGPHRALVYCAKRRRKLRQTSATAEIPAQVGLGANASATATARCPERHQVVSGGFAVPDGGATEVAIHESRRAGRFAWSVSASNTAESPKQVKVFAYCKPGKSKLKERLASGTTDTAFGEPTVGVTPSCLPGERATSWGFRSTSFGFTSSERALLLAAYRVSESAWFVEAVRKGFLAQDFTAYAYCN